MARANKSAAISAVITAIRSGEVADYFTAAVKFKCDRTSIFKKIRSLTRFYKDVTAF
jgi:hypothetical protein